MLSILRRRAVGTTLPAPRQRRDDASIERAPDEAIGTQKKRKALISQGFTSSFRCSPDLAGLIPGVP